MEMPKNMFKKVMVNNETGQQINVIGHVITRNFWEYYITDNKFGTEGKIHNCLVLGDFTEMGDVDLEEIKPYAISVAGAHQEFAPAPGWSWA